MRHHLWPPSWQVAGAMIRKIQQVGQTCLHCRWFLCPSASPTSAVWTNSLGLQMMPGLCTIWSLFGWRQLGILPLIRNSWPKGLVENFKTLNICYEVVHTLDALHNLGAAMVLAQLSTITICWSLNATIPSSRYSFPLFGNLSSWLSFAAIWTAKWILKYGVWMGLEYPVFILAGSCSIYSWNSKRYTLVPVYNT